MKNGKNLMIAFAGAPKSGKTTTLNALKEQMPNVGNTRCYYLDEAAKLVIDTHGDTYLSDKAKFQEEILCMQDKQLSDLKSSPDFEDGIIISDRCAMDIYIYTGEEDRKRINLPLPSPEAIADRYFMFYFENASLLYDTDTTQERRESDADIRALDQISRKYYLQNPERSFLIPAFDDLQERIDYTKDLIKKLFNREKSGL